MERIRGCHRHSNAERRRNLTIRSVLRVKIFRNDVDIVPTARHEPAASKESFLHHASSKCDVAERTRGVRPVPKADCVLRHGFHLSARGSTKVRAIPRYSRCERAARHRDPPHARCSKQREADSETFHRRCSVEMRFTIGFEPREVKRNRSAEKPPVVDERSSARLRVALDVNKRVVCTTANDASAVFKRHVRLGPPRDGQTRVVAHRFRCILDVPNRRYDVSDAEIGVVKRQPCSSLDRSFERNNNRCRARTRTTSGESERRGVSERGVRIYPEDVARRQRHLHRHCEDLRLR